MNNIRMTANIRKQLKKRKEQITDQELFVSEAYRAPLWRLAKVLGQTSSVSLSIFYDETPGSTTALTDGKRITLNTGNAISLSFSSREERAVSHEGLIAHECGHIRCSDFNRRMYYVNGFKNGLCYPTVPKPGSESDRKAWTEMKTYLKQRDQAAIFWIEKAAAYLHNVLEDIYIEAFMCREYPGTIRCAIEKNAEVIIRKIPTFQERKEDGNRGIDIMMDLLFRYARAGKTIKERCYPKEYQTCLNSCKRWIDSSINKNDPDIRFQASNQLLLKIWKYLKKVIRDTKDQIMREKICPEQIPKWLNDHWNKSICWVSLSEAATGENELPTLPKGWNGSLEGAGSEGSDEPADQFFKPIPAAEASSSDEGDQLDILDQLPDILNQLAKEAEAQKEEEERKQMLEKELNITPKNPIHACCSYELHREVEISESSFKRYQRIAAEAQKIAKRLKKLTEDILQKKEGETLRGLYMGKRLNRGQLYRRDGKIFEKKCLSDDEPSLAFAVLVDVSGSMTGERLNIARKTALVLYWFCKTLDVPVLIYGHSSHEPSPGSSEEVVDFYSYAEFDSIDGADAIRIAGMEAVDCNRDGAALRYVGERLLKREESLKILVLISDGRPNGVGYSGEPARKDLLETKHCLERRGVHLFAAAIGKDKELIESIYQNGFLNISDLKTMPEKLVKLLIAYLH